MPCYHFLNHEMLLSVHLLLIKKGLKATMLMRPSGFWVACRPYLKASAIFGMALQLPPIHEPPQQARPTLAPLCFFKEAIMALGWNLLQFLFMIISPPFRQILLNC